MTVSIVIPAYNEEKRIINVIESAKQFAEEIVVIDDGSNDKTYDLALAAGARVYRQDHLGYIQAIKRGFQESKGDIVVTLDADGEHPVKSIPQLIGPIIEGKADVVFGTRARLARSSEYLLTWLTRLKVDMSDPCTGFRALKKQLAIQLKLNGYCTCGILVLESVSIGARIAEVPIGTSPVNKPRRIAWGHFKQIFNVGSWVYKLRKTGKTRLVTI